MTDTISFEDAVCCNDSMERPFVYYPEAVIVYALIAIRSVALLWLSFRGEAPAVLKPWTLVM